MLPVERMWEVRNRTRVVVVSLSAILAIAVVDWATKPYVSLGFLYLFPIMLVAAFLPRWGVVFLGLACALLSSLFSGLSTSWVRLVFETMALSGCGLFVGEVIRNRRLNLMSQHRLKILVETSPAAIVTVDERGSIELANRAAIELLAPRDGHLIGSPIAAYVPELHFALRRDEGPQFRTTLQCRGHRGSGEAFTADVWFSTYLEEDVPKLAAIIADVSEEAVLMEAGLSPHDRSQRAELNIRDIEVLRFVVQGLANKVIADKMQISESTVKNSIQQLFSKAGVRTRSQLVRVALEQYRDLI